MAVGLKHRFSYDDSLDVVGVHLVGGLVGTVGIGFLATSGGLLYGDGVEQLVVQVVVALFAMAWSAAATLLVGLLVKHTLGWRISEEDEVDGIDFVEHGESAYDLVNRGGGSVVNVANVARQPSGVLAGAAPRPSAEGATPSADSAATKEGTPA
jgi:Amt family ammonium transporter